MRIFFILISLVLTWLLVDVRVEIPVAEAPLPTECQALYRHVLRLKGLEEWYSRNKDHFLQEGLSSPLEWEGSNDCLDPSQRR